MEEEIKVKDGSLITVITSFFLKIMNDNGTTVEDQDNKELFACVENLENILFDYLKSRKDKHYSLEPLRNGFNVFRAKAGENGKATQINGLELLKFILIQVGKEKSGKIMLNLYSEICITSLKSLAKQSDVSTRKINHINLFIESLSNLTIWIKRCWNDFFHSYQKTIFIALNQVCKCSPLLLKSFELKHTDLLSYFTRRITECIFVIKNIVNDEHCSDETKPCEFMYLIDGLLDILKQIEAEVKIKEAVELLKPVIDETLCYAMSVAQISVCQVDNKLISSSCNQVLQEYNTLKQLIDIKNIKYKWSCSCLVDMLCTLEERVNIAVLRLYLQVFSDTHSSLKNLIQVCDNISYKSDVDSWDVLVEKFDVQMDRIMQIGLFATSCSSDNKRKVEIDSCLASLESLEAELIPSLKSLKTDNNNYNKLKLQTLVDHWFKETAALRHLIDGIIDPAAFAKVVEEKVMQLLDNYRAMYKNQKKTERTLSLVDEMVVCCRKFLTTIKTSLESSDSLHLPEIQLSINCLTHVLQRCKQGTVTEVQMIKLFKQILLKVRDLKNLLDQLMEVDQDESVLGSMADKHSLLFPDSVRDVPVDKEELADESTVVLDKELLRGRKEFCQLACVTPQTTRTSESSVDDMPALTPFIDRGRMFSKERSVMYTTPRMNKTKARTSEAAIVLNKRNVLSSSRPSTVLRKKTASRFRQELLYNSLDLYDVNSVLDNLSQLSQTFTTVEDKTTAITAETGCLASEKSNLKDKLMGMLDELSLDSDLSCPSSVQFNTLEREKDLKLIDDKLITLKK